MKKYNKQLNVKITEEQHKKITQYAEKKELTVMQVIRLYINNLKS